MVEFNREYLDTVSPSRPTAVAIDLTKPIYDLTDPALVLTISADRRADRPALEADPRDWTVEEAMKVAADFAPSDAVFTDVGAAGGGASTQGCESPALTAAFGTLSRAQCRVTYLSSSPETVSFITLSLAAGELAPDAATPVATCSGISEWAAASAGRLDEAQTLLGQLSGLSDDSSEAVSELRRLADALRDLASGQRTADAPSEVAKANYYMIGAFTDFAAALGDAADGLEASDQAVIDAAADDLTVADARVADAAREIEVAVAACGLKVTSAGDDYPP